MIKKNQNKKKRQKDIFDYVQSIHVGPNAHFKFKHKNVYFQRHMVYMSLIFFNEYAMQKKVNFKNCKMYKTIDLY